MDNTAYYYDLIKIITKNKYYPVLDALAELLRPHCIAVRINFVRQKQDLEKQYWYHYLELCGASRKAFEILVENKSALMGHSICGLEIAKDDFSKTAIRKQDYDLVKKYSAHNFTYDAVKALDGGESVRSASGMIGMETLYRESNSKKFGWRVYVRSSKIGSNNGGRTCWHGEFFLRGKRQIVEKAHIGKIEDFLTASAEMVYESLRDKYFSSKKIDMLKLGRFVTGRSGRRVLTQQETKRALQSAKLFCQRYQVTNYADLITAIKTEKIEEKKKNKKGYRGKWAKVRYGRFELKL